MKHLHTIRDFFRDKYGKTVYRIPIDPGFMCPHREKDGSGGCIFCAPDGGRARHLTAGMPLVEQVKRGIEFVRTRYNADGPYAAYFQAFTPTNTDIDSFRACCEKVLMLAEFKAIFVASRPDTLSDEILCYLEELGEQYDVWVELGVQTANDETLKRINRGHDFASVKQAAERLHEHGIKTAAHVILGLPGETPEDFRKTALALSELPFSGIKVHNLLVIRGTKLERLLDKHEVQPLSEYEYASVLADFLHLLPEDWIVMRLCADAPQETIAAPHWWMDKGAFTDMFTRMFESGDTSPESLKMVVTGDGSYTIYHPKYKQHFHSVAGAWTESEKKYLQPCRVREMLESGRNGSILDVGFGMGFNVCAAVELAESMKNHSKLYITTLEMDPAAIHAACRLPDRHGLKVVQALAEKGHYESENACVDLMTGDARDSVRLLNARFDFIFLDAFSPDMNPELWTLEFVEHLKPLLKDSGYLASYCSAFPFLGALLKSGFHLYESKPYGRRRGGTIAVLDAFPQLPPISRKDYLITTESTAGTPYRDPFLRWTREEILKNRVERVAELRAAGMPKWYKGPLS